MKRTKMMVTTLAMALMAMGSTTAAFAADGENAQLHPFAKGDIIAVSMEKILKGDQLDMKEEDLLKLDEEALREMTEMDGACAVTVTYSALGEDQLDILPGDADMTESEESVACTMAMIVPAEDFDMKDLEDMGWLSADGDLEISDQVMKDADGKEILMKIVKLTDAAQTK